MDENVGFCAYDTWSVLTDFQLSYCRQSSLRVWVCITGRVESLRCCRRKMSLQANMLLRLFIPQYLRGSSNMLQSRLHMQHIYGNDMQMHVVTVVDIMANIHL